MSDEKYWFKTSKDAFNFDGPDTWEQCAKSIPKLTTYKNTNANAGLEEFHTKGLDEYAEEEASLLSFDSGLTTRSESVPNFSNKIDLGPKEDKDFIKGKPTPQQTITRMITGRSYCFEYYKSKEEKIALLDNAIKSHDGDAIMAVVLFLKRTLKHTLFHQEILKRPEAVNHYLMYLELDREHVDLDNMLLMLGRSEDAAILKYKSALEAPHPETKIKRLENCLTTHFQPGSVCPLFVDTVAEHVYLLRRQLPVDEDDARQQLQGTNDKFVMNPRERSLFDLSVISTLAYCCFYHYNLSENHLASPVAIKKQHRLTDKQFVWTALTALSRLHRWDEVENLFTNKNWMGNTKMKCCIGFANAIPVMAKYGAPDEILLKYIRLVDDAEERLALAKRFKFHSLILEILRLTRDRQELLVYKSEVPPKSVESIEVDELLQNSSIKWKN